MLDTILNNAKQRKEPLGICKNRLLFSVRVARLGCVVLAKNFCQCLKLFPVAALHFKIMKNACHMYVNLIELSGKIRQFADNQQPEGLMFA